MSYVYSIRSFCFLYLLAFLGSCEAFAQTAVFSANASANKVGVKDQLQVDYTIQDVPNLRSLAKPDFKDFEVIGGPFQRQSTNMFYSGNKMVQSFTVTHSYVLQPKRVGTLTIPAASAKDADGHTYESNTLSLQVVAGSLARKQPQEQYDPYANPFAAMQQRRRQMQQQQQQQMQAEEQPVDMNEINKNIFIKVSVDKTRAYVGEQITASYKLYTRIPMNVGISKLPSLNGFWTQDFEIGKGNIKPTEEIVDGKPYQVFLLKKSALFPQQNGTLTLDPAEAEGTARIIQRVKQRNPFAGVFDDQFAQQFGSLLMSDPFFNDDFFSTTAYKDVPVKLKSPTVKITVEPLPEKNKPANFGNAVGNFTITAKADKTSLTTDEALTYTLTIKGSGNLKLIEAPGLALPNGLNTYDPQVIDTITGRSTTITGSKIISYTIAPNTPGDFLIPPVAFSYFNTQTGGYVTLQTQPVKMHVDKGKNYTPAIAKNKNLSDIHPISTKPLDKLESETKPVFFSPVYWSMYALPLLAFAGFAVYRRREEELSKDMIRLRNRRANRVAHKRLIIAQKLLAQNKQQDFYEEISKAIWLYLSDKLNIPLSSLSREKAHEVLAQKNVSSPRVQKMDETIDQCETALYAPSSATQQMQRSYHQAVEIISKLEESI